MNILSINKLTQDNAAALNGRMKFILLEGRRK